MWSTGSGCLLKINPIIWGLGSDTDFSIVVVFGDINKRNFNVMGEIKADWKAGFNRTRAKETEV